MDDNLKLLLKEVNNRYFAARVGGRLRFFEDTLPLEAMDKQAFDYELKCKKVEVEIGDDKKFQSIAPIWHEWEGRRYYRHGFILDPNKDDTRDAYNLWRGYGVGPKEGDVSPFLAHLRLIQEDAVVNYVWKWICWIIQNPHLKPKVAIVLRGKEGTGKGFIGESLMRIFGEHALQVSNARHVVGNFNSHLRHVCFLFSDEADFTNGNDSATLKTLITEDRMPLEAKGVDVKQVESYTSLFMSSNESWIVPAALDARRFVVGDVADTHRNDIAYWNPLWQWLNNGGASYLLHAASNENLGDWDPMANRVNSAALREQQMASLKGLDKVLFNILVEGECPGHFPTKWLSEKSGENSMTIYHRLKKAGWEKAKSPVPVGWQPPDNLYEARCELFPQVAWPPEEIDWVKTDLRTYLSNGLREPGYSEIDPANVPF